MMKQSMQWENIFSLCLFLYFRHFLSDQTDPFNRSPLSMEEVIPNTELAEEIKRWIHERKAQASNSGS